MKKEKDPLKFDGDDDVPFDFFNEKPDAPIILPPELTSSPNPIDEVYKAGIVLDSTTSIVESSNKSNMSDSDYNYDSYPGMFGDGISLDETGGSSYSGEHHTTDDSLGRSQIIHKPKWVKKQDNNKNFHRSGPKQRGPDRCNLQPKRSRKRKNDAKTIVDMRNKKRRDKIEAGGTWKKHGTTRNDKEDALLTEAFSDLRDQEFANKEAQIEYLETELENLMKPQINTEFYENAYKEREYYLKNLEEEKKKKDKKTYQAQEVVVNNHLTDYLTNWKSVDYFSFARTSSMVDDLATVENFIKENIDNDELVRKTVNVIGEEINKKPNLADKCSLFLQQLIKKVKPIALAFDSVHDIKLGIDVLKEEFEVELKDPIKYDALSDEYGSHMADVRNDHARRGDLIHRDPLLRHFSIKRIDRSTLIPQQVDYDGIMSAELLFQLLSPSVMSIGATEDVVLAKMQHLAGNIHTINLPKFDIIKYGVNIVDDTLLVARAIFKTRRRVSTALGFPVSPQ